MCSHTNFEQQEGLLPPVVHGENLKYITPSCENGSPLSEAKQIMKTVAKQYYLGHITSIQGHQSHGQSGLLPLPDP